MGRAAMFVASGLVLFGLGESPTTTARAQNTSALPSLPSRSEPKPVEVTTLLDVDKVRPGDTFHVAVIFKIDEKYHLYGIDEKNKDYLGTKVTPPADPGFAWEAPRYPPSHEVAFGEERIRVYEKEARVFFTGKADDTLAPGAKDVVVLVDYQACTDKSCLAPVIGSPIALVIPVAKPGEAVAALNADVFKDQPRGGEGSGFADLLVKHGLWAALGVLLAGGIATAFTPCVLPMIPFTVAFFANQVDRSKARTLLLSVIYTAGIVTTFSVLGYLFGRAGSSAGSLLGNPWVLLAFVAIFAALGLACFGLFELTVPASIMSKIGGGSREGRLGAYFMGLLLGVVAAPCVGPILAGLLVYIATKGSGLEGFLYMLIYGTGLGIPFIALAFVSGALPRAGAWMVWVKEAFGALLFATALYYLTTLVRNPRWIVLLAAVGALVLAARYLLPALRRAESEHRSASLGFVAILLAIYFFAGPTLARVTPIKSAERVFFGQSWLPWITSEEEGLAKARAEGRPAFIDFTAEWCFSCKEMEHMMEEPDVWAELQRFVLIQIDCTANDAPGTRLRNEKYALGWVPAQAFYDSSGQLVRKSQSAIEKKEFLEILRSIDGKKLSESAQGDPP